MMYSFCLVCQKSHVIQKDYRLLLVGPCDLSSVLFVNDSILRYNEACLSFLFLCANLDDRGKDFFMKKIVWKYFPHDLL